ncbi:MAG: glutaredoxin [Oceanospirillaceae bacterium]|jgi:glutaredoxin|nr:glutaredoxin [Oceanospirillaceae bacterium]MBT4442560.1 glutaredoxin [Oceanospirillaceae bacterium]
MKAIRWILGRIILILDFLTSSKPVTRQAGVQQNIDKETASMSLYQFHACPFCVKVRRHLRRHTLHIQLRDAKTEGKFKAELMREGGRHKVPCLKLVKEDGSVEWLYQSNDIIAYLNERFDLA